MIITKIIWLEHIVDKLDWKHNLIPEEVEEVFANKQKYSFFAKKLRASLRNVYGAYGCTDSGRYVTVIFIRKSHNRALVISARDMDKKERKQYGR